MIRLFSKFIDNYNVISDYYDYLVNLTKNNYFVGPTNEWIIDNYYLVAESKNSICKVIREDKILKRRLRRYEKIYYILDDIFKKYNYNLDKKLLFKELNNYQTKNDYYFSYSEISVMGIFITMIVIDRLASFSVSRKAKEIDIIKAEEVINSLEEDMEKGEDINFSKYIKFDNYILEHPVYLYQLSLKLKEYGNDSKNIFFELNNFLKDNNIDIKDIIKNEHLSSTSDNLLVSILFSDLKHLTIIGMSAFCTKISKSEKLLLNVPSYKNMTSESKSLYRGYIIKNSSDRNEYDYVLSIVEMARKSGNSILSYLVKKKNRKLLFFEYVVSIFIITICLSYFLSFYLFDSFILSFLLLIIPVSEVVICFINKIFMFFNREDVLPKMDFYRGIPKEYSTMVVIPTIIKNKDKIDDMFTSLEKIYLSNKSSNLYFSLVADACELSSSHYALDEEISKYGLEVSNRLNKKYGANIFYFMYRKRCFNSSTNSYLGYERKRGAIMHFNKLLLKTMSDADKDKYVYSENISSIKSDIKYVVTIDSDTVVSLGAILKLVGVMAHPYNQPVLNKNKNKVISGYGIIAPKINVDIESTNKSLYTQLLAGIGGFDVYSTVIPNFYQDVFKEGSFVGKGIYDLEVFNTVLEGRFKENTILSHDLLEGNFIRCGFASDIEFIDDFPSHFLVDMSRQHRWTRGDVQILPFIKRKIFNKKGIKSLNPLNGIEKFKILDNIRRELIEICMFLLLILSFLIGNPFITLIIILFIIGLPIIFYINQMIKNRKKTSYFNYYSDLVFGFSSIVSRVYIYFITLPYMAYLRIDAILRALYRMLISHKKLLDWTTAEDASKNLKCDLVSYIKAFKINFLVIIFLIILIIVSGNNLEVTFIVCLSFFLGPFIMFLSGRDIEKDKKVNKELDKNDKDELEEIAKRTWKFFESFLNENNNYLIPDNYQLNREIKEDYKTSPTDIGMSLLAVISSYELGFIKEKEAFLYIEKIMNSLNKLEKWNGLIYNWYSIKEMRPILPFDVSSVDNGNLAACLIVAKEFLKKKGNINLYNIVDDFYQSMNFKSLYTKNDVFSIGYNSTLDKNYIYCYDVFASESRILSFVAISKGDVPFKHWLCLDKSLTKYKGYKGLVSWAGTSFEYFMPLIFMKSYSNTLLDESYFFATYCQEEYMKEIDKDMPWGISECAYGELDDSLNYKYKAFSTPYLKVREDNKQKVVVSPYASILALDVVPNSVFKNIGKLKKLGLYNELGFYESYDYDDKEIIYSYFSHHQGMIISSIANYLKNGILRDYFHSDIGVSSFDILLKEKVQLNPIIDMKIYGYKKYNYDKENVENDIREFNYLSLIPEVSVLSNSNFMLLVNDRGNGFCRYKEIQLNRYRKITEQNYGNFMYIRNTKTGKYWSNTYSPVLVKPTMYNIVFASDRITFVRRDEDITTKTEIIVTKEHNACIYKITLNNHSNMDAYLDVTTYTEPIIINNIDDITHRSFKNLFIKTEYDSSSNSLIAYRGERNKNMNHYYVNKLIVNNPNSISYETERDRFIGRGRNTDCPFAMDVKNLSNTCGDSIDPVMSLRSDVHIPVGKSMVLYFICGYGKSKEQIDDILNSYYDDKTINNAFKYANIANNITTKLLNVTGPDMRNYNIMLNYLYQTSRHFVSKERLELLARNSMNQYNLWKFGISGDRPLILVEVRDSESLNLIREVLKAYEYYKSRSIFVDVAIVNYESEELRPVIWRFIEKEKYRMYALYDFMSSPGDIFLIEGNNLSEDEIVLLNMVARLRFDTAKSSSLSGSIKILQKENKMVAYDKKTYYDLEYSNTFYNKQDLLFYNGYGGFTSDGLEYVVTNPNTPLSWCNVLSNENFGSIVTNNSCGFTYAYNSQLFKITSWTSDNIVNDVSEGIKVNDNFILPMCCVHGFGYSKFIYDSLDFTVYVTQFVSKSDNIKFFSVNFVNKNEDIKEYKVGFFINPTFGPNEEKSSRYLLSEYNEELNSVLIRCVYNPNFSHVSCFMSSTLPLSEYEVDKILFKDITVTINPSKDKDFAFLLGCEIGLDNVQKLIKKYDTIDKVNNEFKRVKDYWNKTVSVVNVKTPDQSFNVISKWLLYQTISSRLNAKAGFYQVGGAYGFRDQLQDSINLCMVDSSISKNQILNNASHQFIEGDVLHWWHEVTHLGLRSRYKDDFLWLVYAVNRYINITEDCKILDIEVPFVKGDSLQDFEEEKGVYYEFSSTSMSIMEHCLLAIKKSMSEIGSNGLPLMGGGDWNDGMNKVGIKGKGTSVWLGFFLYIVLSDFKDILKKYKKINVQEFDSFLEKLKVSLNDNAWDGDYYLRAFFDNGDKLGSSINDECKIDLISQSFSILSSVILPERIPKVLKSIEDNLVDNDLKIVKLLTPAFKKSSNNPGYIMDYPVGIRENGGQYTHSVAWYIMALIKLKKNDLAYKYFSMINPINRSLSMSDVNTYKVEPYVISADIYSNPNHKGRGGWTWYTGSSGWYYNILVSEILGLKRKGNMLYFEPHVPTYWPSFEVQYRYFETIYKIKIYFSDNNDIVLDGDKIDKKYITLKVDKRIHTVVVNIRRS